jgi:lysophospholipase L1-like esterase
MGRSRSPGLSRRLVYPLLAASAAVVVGLAATELADMAVGLAVAPAPQGLIFPPNTQARYRTAEFDYTASVNSLGFRDREFGRSKSAKCRLVAIGDSFTFGWGVAIEQTWPKVLEALLGRAGFGVEVANLGFPGANPADYATVAARAIPMLGPDLVIVGVLLGDDLASAGAEPRVGAGSGGTLRAAAESVARAHYPHLMAVFDRRSYRLAALGQSSVATAWAEQVRNVLASLGSGEKAAYARMDAAIRQAFESGDLNPNVISTAVRRPDYFIHAFDPERPQTQERIRQLSAQLSRIRTYAASARAAVMVAAVPYGLYASRQQFDVRQNGYGFTLDPRMLSSNWADEAIRLAAAGAGVPVFSATQVFRAMDGAPLFFRFDGHFTAAGHRLFAEQLTPAVAGTLEALPAGCRA